MLGDLLRETREQKNLSLEDIEKGTNIRKLYIKAIEDGNYDKLPGEVFLKGFIKTYGKFLGLDDQKLIEQYKAEKNGNVSSVKNVEANKEPEEKDTPESTTETANTTTTVADQNKETATDTPKAENSYKPKINELDANKQYLETQGSGKKKNIFIIIIIIVVIIGGAIAYISSQSSSPTKPAPQQQTSSQEAQPAQEPQQQQQQQPAPQATGSNVNATFSQDCWVEVKVDGKVVLSETVKAGSQLSWQGNQQVDITAGNAGAVDVTFNGQPAGKLGNVGEVVTKSFAAPNAAQAQQAQPAQQQPAQNQAK